MRLVFLYRTPQAASNNNSFATRAGTRRSICGAGKVALSAGFALGSRERAYLAQKGRATVIKHASEFIAQRLAPVAPHNDRRQTPFRGHPVFIAQHVTATCCRTCLAKWHRIDVGRPLNSEEQASVLAAVARWLEEQQGAEAKS